MKKTLLLSLLGIALSSFTLFGENILDFHHLFGRCSGSNAYCSACSNCSACKNCAENGGSCAVCYTPKVVRKPARKSTPKSSSPGFSYRSPAVYRRAGSAQPIKSYPDNYIQPSRISTSQKTSDLAERPVSSRIVSEETVDLVNEEQPLISDTVMHFDYTVDIPLDAEFVRVNAPVANLRTSATTKSQVKQQVKYGELLIKLGASGDWVKVQTLDSGLVGYVFADLVQ